MSPYAVLQKDPEEVRGSYLIVDKNSDRVTTSSIPETKPNFFGRFVNWFLPQSPTNLNNVISHLFQARGPDSLQNFIQSASLDDLKKIKTNLTWIKTKAEVHNSRILVKFLNLFWSTVKYDTSKIDSSLIVLATKIEDKENLEKANYLIHDLNSDPRLESYEYTGGPIAEAMFRESRSEEAVSRLSGQLDQAHRAGKDHIKAVLGEGYDFRDKIVLLKRKIRSLSEDYSPGLKIFIELKDVTDPREIQSRITRLKLEDKEFIEGYIRLLRKVFKKDWAPRGASLDVFWPVVVPFEIDILRHYPGNLKEMLNGFIPLFKILMENDSIIH